MDAIDNGYRPAACPACASDSLRALGALRYAPQVTFAGTEITLQRTPQLIACRDCGSWFTAQAIAPTEAARLYTGGRSDEKWRAEPFAAGKTHEVVRQVTSLLRPGAQVVDVGCNTGELLDFCREHGAVTTGIELSEAASRICLDKGHRMVADLGALASGLDIVFAFDLVEHLYDLPGFLRAVLAALRPGGRLVMLTGDNQSWTARATRPRWWYASYPEHVVFPSWQFWCHGAGFAGASRIRTYASNGYRSAFKARLRGGAKLLAGVGNGLPLVGPDHHLLTLTKA